MPQSKLVDYEDIAGRATIDGLRKRAANLAGRRVKMINSATNGGGVAELLSRLIPLCKDLGIDARWDVIKGDEAFFHVTKQFHHALQGGSFDRLGPRDLATFLETNRRNAAKLIDDEDFVVIHDPQPLALVEARGRAPSSYWIWRCHIDMSTPDRQLWAFLAPYVARYDAAVFSSPRFRNKLPLPQHVFYPSIDPLSDKNREVSPATIARVYSRLGVPRDKPIVIQVSRFDRLKDPLGVMRAFRLARRHVDCRLVLIGGSADDDPEGAAMLAEVQRAANDDPDVHVLGDRQYEDIEINGLVRGATVVVQKSIKEGFGLTVTEAMWKRKAVIAGAAGGLRSQIEHDVTGVLVSSVPETAREICALLEDPKRRARLGEAARARVRREFLITSSLRRWLDLLCGAASCRKKQASASATRRPG